MPRDSSHPFYFCVILPRYWDAYNAQSHATTILQALGAWVHGSWFVSSLEDHGPTSLLLNSSACFALASVFLTGTVLVLYCLWVLLRLIVCLWVLLRRGKKVDVVCLVGVAKKQLWQSGRRGIVEVWKVVDVVFLVGVAKKQPWQNGRRGIVEVWKVVDVVFLVGVAKKQPWQSGRRGIVEGWKSGRCGILGWCGKKATVAKWWTW